MHPGKACRRHWATRGSAANAAVACRRGAARAQFVCSTVCSFSSNWSADKPQCRG